MEPGGKSRRHGRALRNRRSDSSGLHGVFLILGADNSVLLLGGGDGFGLGVCADVFLACAGTYPR